MSVRQWRGKWWSDNIDQFGTRHRHSFATKREAVAHDMEMRSAISSGSYRPDAAKTKVADIAAAFIKDCEERVAIGELRRTTADNYIGHTRRYILGELDMGASTRPDLKGAFFKHPLGNMRLMDVDNDVLERFRRTLLMQGLSQGTVRLVLVTLNRVFRLAKGRRLIGHNPVKEYQEDRGKYGKAIEGKTEVSIPERETVQRLISVASPYGRLAIMFAALTGLRSGEQRALPWRNVDLDKRVVRVERTIDRYGSFKVPKTKAGVREVPIPPVLAEALRDHLATTAWPGPDDLVFGNAKGKPVYHGTLNKGVYARAWASLLATEEGARLKRVSWKSLRHFAVSTWIDKNVPVKRVQRWAGHATAQITLDTYAHLFEKEQHASVIDEIGNEVVGLD